MKKALVLALFGVALASSFGISLLAAERADVPEKYKWKIEDLFATKEAWGEAKAALEKRVNELDQFKGHLGDSGQTLLKAIKTGEEIQIALSKTYLYASMMSDVDTRASEPQAMKQSMEKLGNDFGTATSWFDPELLQIPEDKISGFYKSEPGLAPYKPYLDDVLRAKPHMMSSEEEKVAARCAAMGSSPSATYNMFTSADMPFPEIELAGGEKVRLDQAAYGKYRASEDREVRDRVFKAFWQTYAAYKRTLGTTLYSHVKAHMVTKDLRKYESCLAAALDGYNIPTVVYKQLIADVNTNLPTLHRYLKLRQKMMGVEELRYEDLYAPIVKEVALSFTPEKAQETVIKALAPLGSSYTDVLKGGFESRWIDFMPTTGKRSGAYSTGAAYEVHPYQLLNFNGMYDDVSTLAHESGHSMHSLLSNKNQLFSNAHYSIFVAEVASTFNENLLFHYMLDGTTDENVKLFLLGEFLDGFRQTLFRQTLFAEFEMKIHDMAEAGQPLTGDSLTKLYLELVRRYYGHDAGVCKVDELYGNEWAFIPHFYRNFYVYQYATSVVASNAIANKVREEASAKKPATATRDAYIKMLSAGSSKYPIDLLKDAGVDMTTSEPFGAAMKEMNFVMDQIEAILAKKK